MKNLKIPAQAQELKHGHADEPRPPAGEPRVQLPIRRSGIPAVHVERHLIAPYERDAYGVHEHDQQQLRHDRVAQPQSRSNGGVESRAHRGGDEAVCHEALHDRGHLPVNREFRQQQQGGRDQQAQMRFHVLQERQRHAASPGVPFGHRQEQQRHPHDEDCDDHAPARELQRISRKPRASPEPVERPTAHEGELAQFLRRCVLAARRLELSLQHPNLRPPMISAPLGRMQPAVQAFRTLPPVQPARALLSRLKAPAH